MLMNLHPLNLFIMKRCLRVILAVTSAAVFFTFNNAAQAEANYVYHERTTADPGCGGQFVTTLNPTSAQAYALRFKVEFQFYTDNVRVYYTTDGSTPVGAFGVGSGTTAVVTGTYTCTFGSPLVDVVSATIPAQPAGTVVKYIVSAWHSGGGAEIFGNGPGSPCACGTPTSSAALATVFQYTVASTTDLYWDINGATAGAGGATPTGNWSTAALNWSSVFDGSAATAGWTSGRNAVFAAGNDATGAYTVTIPTALTAGGIKVEEGTVSLGSTAAVTLSAGANVSINSGATLSISSSTAIAPTTSATMTLNGGTMRNTATSTAGSFVSTLFTTLTLNGGGTVSYTGANLLNIINATPKITGTGPLTKSGAGVLAIVGTAAGNNDWTGGTIINDGELRVRTAANALPLTTDLTVNSPGIFNLNGLNQQIGSLSGDGSVGTGGGILTITGAVNTVFSGVLKNITNAGASGVTTGNGRLIKDGIGSITFAGLNDINGSVTITNGAINVRPGASLCGPICDVIVNGGNLNLSNSLQIIENLSSSAAFTGGNINLGLGHTLVCSNVGSSTYYGTISGPGNIIKLNNGATQRTLTLNGANTYDGTTTISGGIIAVGSATALGSTVGYTEVTSGNEVDFTGATVTFTCAEPFRIAGVGGANAGAIAVLASAAPTLSGPVTLTGDATVTVSSSASATFSNPNAFTSTANQTLTLAGGANATGTKAVTGNITLGSGGLTKTQGGEWILSGANSYTGPTLITAGSLALSGSGSISSSTNIAISGGARFDVSRLSSTFALGASQTLSVLGTSAILNGNANLTSGALAITYTNGVPSLAVTNGTLTLNGNPIVVTVTATTLPLGSYKLIAKTTAGNPGSVSGTVPSTVVVNGAGAASVASLQIIGGELFLIVGGNSLLLTTSGNPSGYLSPVTFTATIQTNGVTAGNASGSVTFFTNGVAFSSSAIASGIAVSPALTNLPRGTNGFTALFAGDVNYLASSNAFIQTVTNHPPTLANVTYSRGAVNQFNFSITNLLANNVTDADGDPLLVSFDTSTNGVNLLVAGDLAGYFNTNIVNDQLIYTVTDGFGGTNSATITITAEAAIFGQNASVTVSGSTATVSFVGIPGYSYSVERSTNLVNWATITTTNAPANGGFNFTDDFNDLGTVPGAAYYRLRYNP